MPDKIRIGVDLGGTKIEAIAIDGAGTVMARKRVPTPADSYSKILKAIEDLVCGVEAELGCKGSVGIATPGAVSTKIGGMKNCNTIVLNGQPLQSDVSKILHRPVRIENDANCFTLSEAVDGAAANAEVVFGVILGTGVGGGIVVGKRILRGRNSIAGEWGHNPLPWARDTDIPRPCYCGKSGCIETFLSGPALSEQYRVASGAVSSAQDVVLAAESGNETARACLDAYADRLARALTAVINLLDPDAIVLGGGLSNITSLYVALPPLINKYAFSDGVDTPVLQAEYGDSSGVRGAAWLWPGATRS
jgi:fructokinase